MTALSESVLTVDAIAAVGAEPEERCNRQCDDEDNQHYSHRINLAHFCVPLCLFGLFTCLAVFT